MSNQTMVKQLQEFYLDWIDNYLTIEEMAVDNELTIKDTATLINLGRSYYDLNEGEGTMTNQQIIDLFDSSYITLSRLSVITGKTVKQLKTILMVGVAQ